MPLKLLTKSFVGRVIILGTSMKGKVKLQHRPKYQFISVPTHDFENSVMYSMVWVQNMVFDVGELANFFNKEVKSEGCYLYEVPGITTVMFGQSYTMYIFEQIFG